jgi:hypothetical protein
VLRSTGANFRIQQSYNARNLGTDDNMTLKSLYAGDEYVDQVSAVRVVAA